MQDVWIKHPSLRALCLDREKWMPSKTAASDEPIGLTALHMYRPELMTYTFDNCFALVRGSSLALWCAHSTQISTLSRLVSSAACSGGSPQRLQSFTSPNSRPARAAASSLLYSRTIRQALWTTALPFLNKPSLGSPIVFSACCRICVNCASSTFSSRRGK